MSCRSVLMGFFFPNDHKLIELYSPPVTKKESLMLQIASEKWTEGLYTN